HLVESQSAYRAAFHQELASPLRLAVIEELQWCFREQRRLLDGEAATDYDRFGRLTSAFSAPRYRRLFRVWLTDGDRALDGLSSGGVAASMVRGTGRFESAVLTRQYLHLSSLVGTA